jgi:hypothetical protein
VYIYQPVLPLFSVFGSLGFRSGFTVYGLRFWVEGRKGGREVGR